MLKKRSFIAAELDPPPLALPNAAAPELVKKQRSVHFGNIEVVGRAPVNAQIAKFTIKNAECRLQGGARPYGSIIAKNTQRGVINPPELERCRDRLEALRIATEAAADQKPHMDNLPTKRLIKEHNMVK
jgi:hypothetical protein